MGTARLWAKRSTCSRLHVGAVVAREGRILVTGYNGAPAGMPHCDHDHCDCGVASGSKNHFAGCALNAPCRDSVHAEANAIAYAARYGISLLDTGIFTTHTPCRPCCQLIINAGIKVVVWETDYLRDDGIELLKRGNVALGKYAMSSELDDMIPS